MMLMSNQRDHHGFLHGDDGDRRDCIPLRPVGGGGSSSVSSGGSMSGSPAIVPRILPQVVPGRVNGGSGIYGRGSRDYQDPDQLRSTPIYYRPVSLLRHGNQYRHVGTPGLSSSSIDGGRSESPASHLNCSLGGGDIEHLGDESCDLLVPEERVSLLAKNTRRPAASGSSSSSAGFPNSSSSTSALTRVQQLRRGNNQLQETRNNPAQARNGSRAGAGGTVGKKRPSGMAPITTIETITIVRPLKVIAFICGALAILLLVLCLASSEWLLAQGWRQGLFVHCVSEDAIHPLPFGISSDAGCYAVRTRGYIISSAILCIVAVILDSLATLLTGMGLWSQDSVNKYKYYRIALYIMIGSLVSVLIALIIYPVFFSGELQHGNRDLWEFGWAYGVAWGAAIFLFGGIVLLLLDKESEEIYYKERTVVQESQAGSDAASTSNKG